MGVSEKRVQAQVVVGRRNMQEIENNRATLHHENDPELSALPKPKKPSDQK
jgi:hypothetical protein